MTISIRKLLYLILYTALIQGFLSSYFGLGFINYLTDLFQLFCLLILFKPHTKKRKHLEKSQIMVLLPIIVFTVVIFIGWIINGANALQALWGIRNYFRFFLYFFLCVRTFNFEDYDKIADIILKIFPLHILIILYQFFIERLDYDFLGGIFGKYQGCAGGLMIYYGILTIILLLKYEHKNIKIHNLLTYFSLILLTAALAELKAFFIYFILSIITYSLVTRNKIKGAVIFLLGVFGFFIGLQVLIRYFPSFESFFTLDNIIRQLTDKNASYTYREGLDVGRSSIFFKLEPVISQWGGRFAKWFGLGLGNAEYSTSFSFLNSKFYNSYVRSNYMHFSLSFLFVETGYFGTLAYCIFFVLLEIIAVDKALQNKSNYYSTMNILLPILCLFLVYYNASLRTNYAFIIFAILPIVITSCNVGVHCTSNNNN